MKTFLAAFFAAGFVIIWYLVNTLLVTTQNKILADCGGSIQVVVCSVSSARKSSLRNSELVANIVNGMPDDVHVMLIVNDRSAFRMPTADSRVTFVEISDECKLSIWPQDPFVVLSGGKQTKLVTPVAFGRDDDHQIPKRLAKLLDLEIVHSDLQFEGGNIVADERCVFIGADTIALNALAKKVDRSEIESQFQKLFGRRVITVGSVPQPIGHIDLIVTPLGSNRIAVADSRAGAALAQQELANSPDRVERFERRVEKDFFGRADINELMVDQGHTLLTPEIVGQTAVAIESSRRLADSLDQIATQLAHDGYEVIRIPALIPDQTPRVDDQGHPRPDYPFLSYNNALIDGDSATEHSIVYLPQYGWAALDAAAIQCWEANGFYVRPISGFATSAMYGGSLRCCTKVVFRSSQ